MPTSIFLSMYQKMLVCVMVTSVHLIVAQVKFLPLVC